MKKRHFKTGAMRDGAPKPNFLSYIDPEVLYRYGQYMQLAEAKYGRANWKKGIPRFEYLESLMRHFVKLWAMEEKGVDIEPGVDHASAILFNIIGYMNEQQKEKHDRKE